MQSSSYDLSTPVVNKCIWEYIPKKFLRLHWDDDKSGVRYLTDVSQPGFDPSLKHLACQATWESCDTTKWFVCGWLYIYIYIYIYREREREREYKQKWLDE